MDFNFNKKGMIQILNAKRTLAAIGTALLIGLAACGGTANDVPASEGEGECEISPPVYELQEDESLHSQEAPEMPDWGNYPIIINGVGITDNFFTAGDEIFPTHVPLHVVVNALGLDTMQGGSQIVIQRNGEGLAELSVINYLTFGDDRIEVSQYDTFMADDDNFTIYVPIWLFREMGFSAYSTGGHVYIYEGESDMH